MTDKRIPFDAIVGKTIKAVKQMQDGDFDDDGFIKIYFTDGTSVVLDAGYTGYTGRSRDEYPTQIRLWTSFKGLRIRQSNKREVERVLYDRVVSQLKEITAGDVVTRLKWLDASRNMSIILDIPISEWHEIFHGTSVLGKKIHKIKFGDAV